MSTVRRLGSTSVHVSSVPKTIAHGQSESRSTGPEGLTEEIPASVEAYRKAYVEGFDAGFCDGEKDALSQHLSLRRQLEALTEEAASERSRWSEAIELALSSLAEEQERQRLEIEALGVEIAYAAVCKIVGDLQVQKHLVSAVVAEILMTVRSETLQVRVATADLPSLTNLPASIEVVGDPSLLPGDCVLRSAQGDIDGGVRTQLAKLRSTLHEALGIGVAS